MRPLRRICLTIFAAVLLAAPGAHATGYYGPDNYLDNGGKNVEASPEFFWESELKRLARPFHPPEKRLAPEAPKNSEEYSERGIKRDQSAAVDAQDFAKALKEGRIKPPDPAKAQQQHEAARKAIEETVNESATPAPDESPASAKLSNDPLPEEFPSEFADYHKGAYAWTRGPQYYAAAKSAWEALLQRPEAERPYRTLWTTFMLGRLALKNGDFAGAARIFEQVREMARAGVIDSLGLAADSYGWEGRAEWKQGHDGKAAELFLTQLATGDLSAIVSLKALIPDREPVEGLLNYGDEPDEPGARSNDQQKKEEDAKEMAALKTAAQDPLLRKLVTAHILATASTRDIYESETGSKPVNRCARWLSVIAQVKPSGLDDAEYLGWVAYNNGDYKAAAKWLEMAKPDAAASLWLKSKLQRRAGKLPEAAQSMEKAWEGLSDANYTGWDEASSPDMLTQYRTAPEGLSWGFRQSASGDLGALRLSRNDFVQAFDTFRKGRLWNDAAFVGERVLTANELKTYVDQQTEPATEEGKTEFEKLRYLLGRRLVREDRYAEAGPYLRPPYDKVLAKYVKALQDGANEKLGKEERAHAWFTAAWLARYDGMELMGTEVAPDDFVEDGQFEVPDLAQEFEAGKYVTVKYDGQGNEKKTANPVVLKPSKEEVQRLLKNKIRPDKRFHYRLIAGELAMKAARLLPENAEQTADVINSAGRWVKDRDEKTGNEYFGVLQQRAGNTTIGRAAKAKHWFVEDEGPWSMAEAEARKAMREELKMPAE